MSAPLTPYPHAWQRAATTRDGVPYRIRPIRAEDTQREIEFIRGLSEESRYNRLMYAVRQPSRAFIEQLVHVNYLRTMAFVAIVGTESDERLIGVARYAADPTGSACEFAVVVADKWQSRGIGTTLTRLLFEYARAQGFERVYGTILPGNRRMIDLAHWVGLKARPCPDDPRLVEASCALASSTPAPLVRQS